MTKKLYNQKDDEYSESLTTLDQYKEQLGDLLEKDPKAEIIIEEFERDFGSGTMWCTENFETVENSKEVCGIDCPDYKPRNGKSGRCKFLDNTFKPTGKVFRLTKDGLKENKNAKQ